MIRSEKGCTVMREERKPMKEKKPMKQPSVQLSIHPFSHWSSHQPSYLSRYSPHAKSLKTLFLPFIHTTSHSPIHSIHSILHLPSPFHSNTCLLIQAFDILGHFPVRSSSPYPPISNALVYFFSHLSVSIHPSTHLPIYILIYSN